MTTGWPPVGWLTCGQSDVTSAPPIAVATLSTSAWRSLHVPSPIGLTSIGL